MATWGDVSNWAWNKIYYEPAYALLNTSVGSDGNRLATNAVNAAIHNFETSKAYGASDDLALKQAKEAFEYAASNYLAELKAGNVGLSLYSYQVWATGLISGTQWGWRLKDGIHDKQCIDDGSAAYIATQAATGNPQQAFVAAQKAFLARAKAMFEAKVTTGGGDDQNSQFIKAIGAVVLAVVSYETGGLGTLAIGAGAAIYNAQPKTGDTKPYVDAAGKVGAVQIQLTAAEKARQEAEIKANSLVQKVATALGLKDVSPWVVVGLILVVPGSLILIVGLLLKKISTKN